MPESARAGFAFLLIASMTGPTLAAAPLEAYGRLPTIEQAVLSPDGMKVAYIQTTEDWRALVIVDLGATKLIASGRVGDAKVSDVAWADDSHLLVTTASKETPFELSGPRNEWHLLSVYNLDTQKWRGLLERVKSDGRTMNVISGMPVVVRQNNETVVYVHGIYVRAITEPALFRINLITGAEALIKHGGGETDDWLVDDSGEIIAEKDYYESDRRWAIRLFNHGRIAQTVSGVAPIDDPEVLGLSPEGDAIVVSMTEAQGQTWRRLHINDGKWDPEPFNQHHVNRVLHRAGSTTITGTAFVEDAPRYFFFDPKIQGYWDWIDRVFGFQRVELVSASADYSRMIVQVLGPKSGYAYYIADAKEHYTALLGKTYKDVTTIAEVRPVKYAAGDGLEIPAYLTMPPGGAAKNLPLIVMPHGGPEARDSLDFDWWAQALAAQGYAVLQPNFRGSSLDKAWVEAGYGQWGRKMQTDLSDGVGYLAKQGIVDPERVCIVGASYGGYAALAGVSLQSGIYRCAVAVAPVSDPATMMRWVADRERYGDKIGLRYWERFMGANDPADKSLDSISPLKHAGDVTVPVLLIHGREDVTVPYEQSMDMQKALQRANKPVQLVALDKEDHNLSRSATRLQMLKACVDFLKQYNPPD